MLIRKLSHINEMRRVVGITIFLEANCEGERLILEPTCWDLLG